MARVTVGLHNICENKICPSTRTRENPQNAGPRYTAKSARASPFGLYKDFIILGRD